MSSVKPLLFAPFRPLVAMFSGSKAPFADDPETPDIPTDLDEVGVTLIGDDAGANDLVAKFFDDSIDGLGAVEPLDGTACGDLIAGGTGDGTGAGGVLDDTIAGRAGADMVSREDGDDILYSPSWDAEADTSDRGLGADTVVMGKGDVAFGGKGADAFISNADVGNAVLVTDFDAADDMLIVESMTPDDVAIEYQTVTVDGVLVRLSTGETIFLQGLEAPIDPVLVRAEFPGWLTAS